MIQDQINAIGDALAWIKKHKPEQYDQRFQQLVEERLKLRKIQEALREHPAIAAYGESQKGKTHVMNSLLLKDGKPFEVETPEGMVKFIDEINPIVDNQEATGVVTRFTSFEMADGSLSKRYRPEHPVLIKVLNVADMATIFCDSYFNDIDSPHLPETAQINEFAQSIESKYSDYAEVVNPMVSEDDILEMRNYMMRNLDDTKQKIYTNSSFFFTLSRVISRIPFEDLPTIFSILWNNNNYMTEQFARLTRTIQSIGFAREIYADIDTIRNNQNTIMAVDCLAGLMPAGWKDLESKYKSNVEQARYTHVFFIDAHGTEHRVDHVAKCELAAICAEIVLRIDAKNLETDVHYDLSRMPVESQMHICKNGFRKDLFHSNDLLDFPGARTRDQNPIEEVGKNIDQMVKRGKVAYLFHKYSEGHIFNIMLYCHDQYQASVKEMYKLLAKWVRTFVGRTPEERARMIQRTQVPPFFIVATKFNCDMIYDSQKPSANTEDSLRGKWFARFDKVLWDECLGRGFAASGTNDQWFINWLASDGSRPFNNSYVLRDFKYSSGSVYSGYNANADEEKNPREKELAIPQSHYDSLRRTFIESPHVKHFFSNPALAWDVATTLNNDGSQYIIERVSIVANHIGVARQEQLADKQAEIAHRIEEILKDYYVDEDADKLLKANVKKAKKVMREMDFCIQSDNYFFGHMIECLQTTERETYTVLHKLVQGTELNQKTTDFGNVSLVLKRYGKQLEACKNDEERWAVLQEELVMDSRQEVEEYLSRKGIDPTTIFAPSTKKHQNSVIIADKTFDAWEGKLRSPSLLGELSNSEEFDSVVMGHLIDNIVETAKQMQLSERIAALIAEYVNVLVTTTINESLVADLMATEINNFVNTLGYAYREAAEVNKLKELAEELNLTCFDHIGVPRQESFTEEELTKMFDDFNENENTLTPSFALNYELWIEYMMISFIGKNAVGDYDREANRQMGEIIKMIK